MLREKKTFAKLKMSTASAVDLYVFKVKNGKEYWADSRLSATAVFNDSGNMKLRAFRCDANFRAIEGFYTVTVPKDCFKW